MPSQEKTATLITGGAGFIGLALCETLLTRGENVVAYDGAALPPKAVALFATLPGRLTTVGGDVRDTAALKSAMEASGVDRVVTLAAITADIERERRAARSIFDVNVGGVIATIEAAHAVGVRRMVHVSSGAVYGAAGYQTKLLVEEETPTQPENLYGITKLSAEQVVLRLASVLDMSIIIGRLGTCFGPWEHGNASRDTPSAVLQIITKYKSGEKVALPRAHRRDWLYSRDAAQAIVSLLDDPSPAHAICNLAAGFKWSLAELCHELSSRQASFAWELSPDGTGNIALYGTHDRAPMSTQRLAQAGFKPQYNMKSALSDYLQWWDMAGVPGKEEPKA
jgi:UDP-glucuronate 4-epimerase